MMKKHSTILIATYLFLLFPLLAIGQPATQGQPELLIKNENMIYQNPEWSPDGSKIAFTSARYNGIWVSDADGNNIQQLTEENGGFGFSWSPDSESILARVSEYENRRRNHAIKVFHVDNREADQLTEFRSEMPVLPKWAAFGEQVVLINNSKIEAFDSGKEIPARFKQRPVQYFYVLKTDAIARGKIPENSTEDISPFDDATYLNMEVSPDGQKIVFEVYGGNLYVMNVDGSNVIDLGRANRPSWSPDSRYVVATISEDDGHNYQSSDIYALSVDGNQKINLTENTDLIAMNPSWSPDGDKIAFDAVNDGAIYVLNIRQ